MVNNIVITSYAGRWLLAYHGDDHFIIQANAKSLSHTPETNTTSTIFQTKYFFPTAILGGCPRIGHISALALRDLTLMLSLESMLVLQPGDSKI